MPALSFTRFPALLALISQLAGILSTWLLLWLLARLAGWTATPMLAAGLQGLLAALIGQRLGLPRWWLPINLCFMPGLVLTQGHTLPPWLLLCGFAVLLLLNWNALLERVPLYLTGSAAEQELHRRLDRLPAGFRFVDLGSGLGGPLLRLARAFPQGHFVGVESAPLAFLVCRVRCLLQPNCHVYLRNFWREPLAPYDVVYCFLSPAPMPALWSKACAEMRADALLISNSFAVPDAEPDEVVPLDDWRHSRLLVYRPNCAARS